jgi:hypothetical protein
MKLKPLSVKLSEDDLKLLAAKAAEAGEQPSTHARHLLQAALRTETVAAKDFTLQKMPVAAPIIASDERLRRAIWCLLVGLSPDLDEDQARAFVETYFDQPMAPGYVPSNEVAKP